MRKFLISSVASAVTAFGSLPAMAQQTVAFDAAQVQAICAASPQQCRSLIAQIISQLESNGLSAAELNSQLGVLASAVVSAAQSSNAPNTSALTASLNAIANASSDDAQVEAIRAVSQQVASGNAGDIDTSTPIGASPA